MSQMGRAAGARRVTGFLLVVAVLVLSGAPELQARSSYKLPCKKIHDAVWTGRTLDDDAAQFGTDTEHVIHCIQKPGGGKQKKAKKSKNAKHNKAKPANHSAVQASPPILSPIRRQGKERLTDRSAVWEKLPCDRIPTTRKSPVRQRQSPAFPKRCAVLDER